MSEAGAADMCSLGLRLVTYTDLLKVLDFSDESNKRRKKVFLFFFFLPKKKPI